MSSIKSIYDRNLEILRDLEKKLIDIAKEFNVQLELNGKEIALKYLDDELSNFKNEFENLYNNVYKIMDTKIKLKFLGDEDKKYLKMWEELGDETRQMLRDFRLKQEELMKLPNVKKFIFEIMKSGAFKNITFEYISKNVGVSIEEIEEIIIDMIANNEIKGQVDLVDKSLTFETGEEELEQSSDFLETGEMDIPIPVGNLDSNEQKIEYLDINEPPSSSEEIIDETFLEIPPEIQGEEIIEDVEIAPLEKDDQTQLIEPETVPIQEQQEQIEIKEDQIQKQDEEIKEDIHKRPVKHLSVIERIAQKLNVQENLIVEDKKQMDGEVQEIPKEQEQIMPSEKEPSIEEGPILESLPETEKISESKDEIQEKEEMTIEDKIELVDKLQSEKKKELIEEKFEKEAEEEVEEIPLLDINIPPPSSDDESDLVDEFLEAPPAIDDEKLGGTPDASIDLENNIEINQAELKEDKAAIDVDTSALLDILKKKKEVIEQKPEIVFDICPFCNHSIKNDSKVCAYCNKELKRCIICGKWLGPDSIQCPYCHKEVHKKEFYDFVEKEGKCPNCHEELTKTDLEFAELI
ncbi:MAG: zinc ribbon domain-containing protein [Candidatus Helarchaeota archaeon]